ncbi:MAG: hypothetical protein ACFFHV_20735 [Promethearchaeota archaeon]
MENEKETRVTFTINDEIYEDFLKCVVDLHRKTHGTTKIEVNNALKLYIEARKNNIDLELAKRIFEKESEHNIFQKMEELNLHNIYRWRRHEDEKEFIKKAYETAIWNSTEVLMMGISLIDFFVGEYLYIIEKALSLNVTLKILLLHPDSNPGRFRAKIEEPEFEPEISTLFKDLFKVTKSLKKFSKEFPNQIEVHFSEDTLTSYCLICDDYSFIETYHSGKTKGLKEHPAYHWRQSCIGGIGVPYYVFENGTLYPNLLRDSFLRLFEAWKENDLDKVYNDMKKYI